MTMLLLRLVLSVAVCGAGACVGAAPVAKPVWKPDAPVVVEPAPAKEPVRSLPWEAEVAVFNELNRRRLSRDAVPLHIDRGLALVAQSTAKEYQRLGRGSDARVLAGADRDLQAFSLTFERTASAVVFAERIDEAVAALGVALDPQMRWIGVAVVDSPPPVGPRGGYAVVLALGQ